VLLGIVTFVIIGVVQFVFDARAFIKIYAQFTHFLSGFHREELSYINY